MKINFNFKRTGAWIINYVGNNRYKHLLFLFIFCLALAAFLFYRFALKPIASDTGQAELTKINYELYDKISDRLQKKQNWIKEESEKTYQDIFK